MFKQSNKSEDYKEHDDWDENVRRLDFELIADLFQWCETLQIVIDVLSDWGEYL